MNIEPMMLIVLIRDSSCPNITQVYNHPHITDYMHIFTFSLPFNFALKIKKQYGFILYTVYIMLYTFSISLYVKNIANV